MTRCRVVAGLLVGAAVAATVVAGSVLHAQQMPPEPGQGGDAESNANRWADQFTQPDGSSASKLLKTRKLDVNGIAVLLTEVAGTYRGGMPGGPAAPERPNYMLLGAIARGPDANWFFKVTGPRATLEAQRAAFEAMIKSLKRGG